TIPRMNYFEEVELSDWSFVSFLEWRSRFSDFSDKEVEHSSWKALLINISNTSSYGIYKMTKAQELLFSFEQYNECKYLSECLEFVYRALIFYPLFDLGRMPQSIAEHIDKKSYSVEKFWEKRRIMYFNNRLKTISMETKLQMAISDHKYVVNKSEEETNHSVLIGKRRHQILKNELEPESEDTLEPIQKQNRRQTRYGRNIPDYSEQESDHEPEKRIRITQPELQPHRASKNRDDRPEIDNENYDEKTELFFKPSDISTIKGIVTESIISTTDELVVKLLRWQQSNLEQICHGVHIPEEQNIYHLLSVSSIFYLQQRNEQSYLGFLTENEISKIRSDIISKFVKITTPQELINFVSENKKKFQRDSQEEISRFIKLSAVKYNGNLLNETFFNLLEECATWNPLVDVNKMNEGTFIVDYIGPLFNKTIHYFNYVSIHSWIDIESEASKSFRGRGRVPDYMLKNKDETRVGVFCEVISPKRQDEKNKIYWGIYRGSIHAKDSIDLNIKQQEMHPNETNQIIIFINGHKMERSRVTYKASSIDEYSDSLGERYNTTPIQTNYSIWLRPTADTPTKKNETICLHIRKSKLDDLDL
ncbi:15748_t:CDS:10, partial [Gigaspora margarita]